MDIANLLAVIDRLCVRDLPAEDSRTHGGTGGPGYLMAELQHGGDPCEGDGTGRQEEEAQFEADRDALGERLAERWGPAQLCGLDGVFLRAAEGEEAEEPWSTLAARVPDVHLWRTDTGRWMALGISRRDSEGPLLLLAVATTTDPP